MNHNIVFSELSSKSCGRSNYQKNTVVYKKSTEQGKYGISKSTDLVKLIVLVDGKTSDDQSEICVTVVAFTTY